MKNGEERRGWNDYEGFLIRIFRFYLKRENFKQGFSISFWAIIYSSFANKEENISGETVNFFFCDYVEMTMIHVFSKTIRKSFRQRKGHSSGGKVGL